MPPCRANVVDRSSHGGRSSPHRQAQVKAVGHALEATWRWRVSYWDAAIIEAARMLDCDQLVTEDLNAGQVFDGVTVVNPFSALTDAPAGAIQG